jgi:hypothetical protein
MLDVRDMTERIPTMAEEEPVPKGPRYLPGYFRCRRAIDRLERFKDLVRHHQRWAHQIEFARPLSQLIPPVKEQHHEHTIIEVELNKMIPLVSRDLDLVGIQTRVSWNTSDPEFDYDNSREKYVNHEHHRDLIDGYFEMQREEPRMRGQAFDLVLQKADRGIGVYEHLKSAAIHRTFNQIWWLAYLVSIPVRVLDHAGLGGAQADSKLVSAYGWTLRIVFLLILAFGATKLGITIPWREMLKSAWR